MIEQDTIKLLRECDAGIQMGVSAIDEVMDYVTNDSLKKQLEDCKTVMNHCVKNWKSFSTATMMMENPLIPWPRVCPG